MLIWSERLNPTSDLWSSNVSTVWSPSEIALIDALESVQRRFTKRLPGFSNMSYADRLITLNLQSLEHRRLINDFGDVL